jgi:hypothetical protein
MGVVSGVLPVVDLIKGNDISRLESFAQMKGTLFDRHSGVQLIQSLHTHAPTR